MYFKCSLNSFSLLSGIASDTLLASMDLTLGDFFGLYLSENPYGFF